MAILGIRLTGFSGVPSSGELDLTYDSTSSYGESYAGSIRVQPLDSITGVNSQLADDAKTNHQSQYGRTFTGLGNAVMVFSGRVL